MEAVHDILDALPNAPTKTASNGYTNRTLTARLAGYFASTSHRVSLVA